MASPGLKDVNPGDVWRYRNKDYFILGTAVPAGAVKSVLDGPKLFIIYKSIEHPLFFIRERHEFIKKFDKV